MEKSIETKYTGWAFIAAALMILFGWELLHHHLGQYIVSTDFAEVNKHMWYWIWMYRIHIFGWVTMTIAVFSFITIASKKPYGAILVSGGGVLIAGSFIIAIASAFYYGFGTWGIGQTEGMTEVERQLFVDDLMPINHYVTCFLRFGRVFSGAGMLILGVVMVKWKLLNPILNWFTAAFGLVILCVILFIPDCFESYKPLTYVKVLWLLSMGIFLLKDGVKSEEISN